MVKKNSMKFWSEIIRAYVILNDPEERVQIDQVLRKSKKYQSKSQRENPFFKARSRVEQDFDRGFSYYSKKDDELEADFEDIFPSFKFSSKSLIIR